MGEVDKRPELYNYTVPQYLLKKMFWRRAG
jgi:hypothetical protein